MSRISPCAAAVFAITFLITFHAPSSRAGLEFEVITESGDVLPGAEGAPLLGFEGFSVSPEGVFLFKARLTGEDDDSREGLWVGAKGETWTLEKLALEGEFTQVEGLTAERFAAFGSFSINEMGQIAYEARLDTETGAARWWDQDLIAQSSSDNPQAQELVARLHRAAPYAREADGTPIGTSPEGPTGNRVFGDTVMGSDGFVSYTGIVGTFPPTDTSFKRNGVLYRTPDLPGEANPELLIAEGMSFEIGDESVVITEVSPLRKRGDRAILLAAHTGDDGSSGQGLWSFSTEGGILPLALTGQEAEGANGKHFEWISQPHLNALGDAVFSASLTEADGSGNAEGIWKLDGDGLHLVTMTGEATGENLPALEQLADPQIDENGQVTFLARWTDEATGRVFQAIYRATAEGVLRSVVNVDDPVPNGRPGESFTSFSRPFLGATGDLVFVATTRGPESTGYGCWYAAADGSLHGILRQSDQLPLGSDGTSFRNVTDLYLHGADREGNLILEVAVDGDASALLAARRAPDDPGQGTYTLAGLEQTYDGSEKTVRVSPNPGALSVSFTYDDASSLPVAAGNYDVRATLWNGRQRVAIIEDTLTISKAPQMLQLSAPPSEVIFGDLPFDLAPTNSSGLPVQIDLLSGPARVADGVVTWAGTGLVSLQLGQAGDTNHEPAAPVLVDVTVLPPGEQTVEVREGETVGIPVLPGLPEDLSYLPGRVPEHGQLEGSGKESVYRPFTGFGGEDSFSYLTVDPVTGAQTEVPVLVKVERTTGLLEVVLNTAGGGWRLPGESRFLVGLSTERYLAPGSYEVEFRPLPGYEWPQPMNATIEIGGETILHASYTEIFSHPFQGWRREVFNEDQLEDPAVSEVDADFDRDGFTTWMEFAFNLDPLQADRLTFSSDPPSDNLPHLRLLGAEEAPDKLELTYLRRKDRAEWRIVYDIGFSSNLVDWVSGVDVATEDIDETRERVTVRPPAAPGLLETMMWARLMASDAREDDRGEQAP